MLQVYNGSDHDTEIISDESEKEEQVIIFNLCMLKISSLSLQPPTHPLLRTKQLKLDLKGSGLFLKGRLAQTVSEHKNLPLSTLW